MKTFYKIVYVMYTFVLITGKPMCSTYHVREMLCFCFPDLNACVLILFNCISCLVASWRRMRLCWRWWRRSTPTLDNTRSSSRTHWEPVLPHSMSLSLVGQGIWRMWWHNDELTYFIFDHILEIWITKYEFVHQCNAMKISEAFT